MKLFTSIITLFFAISVFAQNVTPSTGIKVKVTGTLFNMVQDSVHIGQFFGKDYKNLLSAKINKKTGNYSISGTLPVADYYVLRTAPMQHVNLIFTGKESEINVHGDASNIGRLSNIVGSEPSRNMKNFIADLEIYNVKKDSAMRMMQQFPDRQKEIDQSFQPIFYGFQSTKQAFIQQNQNSPALVATLSTIDVTNEFQTYESVINQLNVGFGYSPTIIQITQQFKQAQQQREESNFKAPGKLAPNITMAGISGKEISLSDLKGKVVLIDFWASWCKPCRGANPQVVALYNKYKAKGFDVFSVSLDQNKEAWLAAIQKDGLIWPSHVSDLKGWQNAAAQQYKVQGIPFTMLIDQEGKVIATELREQALDDALIKVFGF